MYNNGEGIRQNYKEAYIWWSIASSDGNQKTKEHLKRVKEMLSPEHLIEAQSRSTELFKQIEEGQ